MFRLLSIILILSITPAIALADCQLGESCDYFNNDIMIAPPYIGTYKCVLDPANLENLTLEVRMLTTNTIADPAPLVLNNDNRIGVIKVTPHSGQNKNLLNAFHAIQTTTAFCDGTSDKNCDIQPTIMCERIAD